MDIKRTAALFDVTCEMQAERKSSDEQVPEELSISWRRCQDLLEARLKKFKTLRHFGEQKRACQEYPIFEVQACRASLSLVCKIR